MAMELVNEHSNIKGTIFDIQKYCIHDGPGIRTTVFLKGCYLECKWCSNPESIKSEPELMLKNYKCTSCGECTKVCPKKAIFFDDNNQRRINWHKCNNCLECVNYCNFGALIVCGQLMSVKETMTEIEKDYIFYKNSGGGVTFSGGEPLMQDDFLYQLLKKCNDKGIHTAIDTSGCVSWSAFEKAIDYTDLFLFDLKHIDSNIHEQYTKMHNKQIISNLSRLRTQHEKRVWVRIPIIPDINDSMANIDEVAKLCRKLGVEKISLIPYHEGGKSKCEQVGKPYLLSHNIKTENANLEQIKKIIENNYVECSIGY